MVHQPSFGTVDCLRIFKWVTAEGGNPQLLIEGVLKHGFRGVARVNEISGAGSKTQLHIGFEDGDSRTISIGELQDGRNWRAFAANSDLVAQIISAKSVAEKIPEQIEFKTLREKYHVSKAEYSSLSIDRSHPTWKFLNFLRKLDAKKTWCPDTKTLEWLHAKQMFGPLALIMDRRFRKSFDAWDAARASKYWRLVGDYESALKSTVFVNSSPPNINRDGLAAALTSRAAVLRHFKRYTDAEDTLRRAYGLTQNSEYLQRAWGALDNS
jgi:hypothetical protein